MRDRPIRRNLRDIVPVECPCGQSWRIITAADDTVMGFHVTAIHCATPHFHRRATEIYHVLDGSGRLILGGSAFDVTPGSTAYVPPGSTAYVPPGCIHHGEGDFTAAIAILPPFDPSDEFSARDMLPEPSRPPIVRHIDDIEPIRSACGSSSRIITRHDGAVMGLHVVRIKAAECHYHIRTTEIYHILEGEGTLTVDRESYELSPGVTIYVPPGLEHGGDGDFRSIVICAPPFDPEDQIVV